MFKKNYFGTKLLAVFLALGVSAESFAAIELTEKQAAPLVADAAVTDKSIQDQPSDYRWYYAIGGGAALLLGAAVLGVWLSPESAVAAGKVAVDVAAGTTPPAAAAAAASAATTTAATTAAVVTAAAAAAATAFTAAKKATPPRSRSPRRR